MEYFDFEIEDSNGDLFASLFPARIDSHVIGRESSDSDSLNLTETKKAINIVVTNRQTDENSSVQSRGRSLRSVARKRNMPETESRVSKRRGRPPRLPKPSASEVEDLSCSLDGETSSEALADVFQLPTSLPTSSGTNDDETLLKSREKSPPNYIIGRRRMNDPVVAEASRSNLVVPREEDGEGSNNSFLINATKSHMQKYFMRRKKTSASQKPEGTSGGVSGEENKPRRTIRRRKKPKTTYITKKMRNERYKHDIIPDNVLSHLIEDIKD